MASLDATNPLAPAEGPDPAEQAWRIYVTALSNAWVRRIFGRSDLGEIERIPLAWLVNDGPVVVDELVRNSWGAEDLGNRLERKPQMSRAALESVAQYAELRRDVHPDAAGRDLLALQSLLTETLSRETDDGHPEDAAARIARLATLFEQLQDRAHSITKQSPGALADLLTSEHGDEYLREWLGNLTAEYERYGTGFAVLLISIDGLDYIVNVHGQVAAASMADAIREIIVGQLRTTDRLFRRGTDQFCVLAPNQEVANITVLAERLRTVIDSVQRDDQPRVSIAAGISSCPLHGTTPEALIAAAEEATWLARSSGTVAALQSV